jgi:hypothetical protein
MKDLKLNKLIDSEMSKIQGGGKWSKVPAGTMIYIECPEGGYDSVEGYDPSCCGCACYYANSGGSSIADNLAANKAG